MTMEEENDFIFMEFSVVDECGSDEEEENEDSHQDGIHVLDEVDSSKPSKNEDFFEDMVVLDISTSPTKEIEMKKEKTHTSHKSDRSHRLKESRSPYRESSNKEKRNSGRESSRKEEEKRNDRRKDRSRSKESRYRSSSDRRKRSREREQGVQEKSSGGRNSQRTSAQQSSKSSRSHSSTPSEKKDTTKSKVLAKTSISKSTTSAILSIEIQKTEKEKDTKEESTTKKASMKKEETDSEGEGITINADDNILTGIDFSDLGKSDFVTLTVVDEDDQHETQHDSLTHTETAGKSLDFRIKQTDIVDAKENMPVQSSTKKPELAASESVTQESENGKSIEKPTSDLVEKKKASMKVSEKPVPKKASEKPKSNTEIEMVVVKDIDEIENPLPNPHASSTPQRNPVNEDLDKFKVMEELFPVESVEKTNKEVSIIGVDNLLLSRDEGKQQAQTQSDRRLDSKGPDLVEVAIIPDRDEVNIVGIEHMSKSQDTNYRKEEKLFEVAGDEEEEMEISIMDESKVGSSEYSEKEETDDDVIEVIFSNGEDEEETPVTSTTEFNNTFRTGFTENDNLRNSTQGLKTESEYWDPTKAGLTELEALHPTIGVHPEQPENCEQPMGSETSMMTKQGIIETGTNDIGVNFLEKVEIESIGEPDNVIEDGMEIIVLSDTDTEENSDQGASEDEIQEITPLSSRKSASDLGNFQIEDSEKKWEESETSHVEADVSLYAAEDSQSVSDLDNFKMEDFDEKEKESEASQVEADISLYAAEDSQIEDGTEITIEDDEEQDEDNLGEIDEDAFLAMMQSEGLDVEDCEDVENQDETKEEAVDDGEQLQTEKDSSHLFITVSQTSEKRNVKSATDSQEKSRLRSPIDRISSNLAKIRKEVDKASKQPESDSENIKDQEKNKATKSSTESSKDKNSRSSQERSKDKKSQRPNSGEKDLRQVIQSKKSQNSRDLRNVIKQKKARENEATEAEDQNEELPLGVDEYLADEEELVEVDTFYDDYQEKKVEMVVVQDEALLPKEKEHWGYDTVGDVLRLPMKMKNVSIEDLESESATSMLEGFDAFFVDLDSGEGALYVDNSELKTMRPFIMIGRIARFLKDHPHVDVECEKAISFLLEEKMKTVGIKKKNQIPKKGLLYIRGVPNHITEERLTKSLKAKDAIIPKNLMDKRIGFAMVIYETTEEVREFLATLKIFDKTCIRYQEIFQKQKELEKQLQKHPEAKGALLDGETQLHRQKQKLQARKKLMAIQKEIMKKNKEKIKKTNNKALQKKQIKQKKAELRKLMERAKKIVEEEGLDENLSNITGLTETHSKGRSMEEHERLRSPLKNAEQRRATMSMGIVSFEGSIRDADYNRLRREVLEELKIDITNGKFRDGKQLEDVINRRIDSKHTAETRSRMWGSGVAVTQTTQPAAEGAMYTMNQFKDDFRKARIPVQGASKVDSGLPNLVPDSIEIMIPVPEGTIPMHNMSGSTQIIPATGLPAPIQMLSRQVPVISNSQMPISNIPGVSSMASAQQPPGMQTFPQHSQMPSVSGYVQSNRSAMPVSTILPGTIGMRQVVPGAIPTGVPMQPQNYTSAFQRPPVRLPISAATPRAPQVQTRPGPIGYPRGSVPPGSVPHGARTGHFPLANPPGTVPRAPVPRVPVPVVAPTTPAIIQSQPIIYKPPTSEAPATGSTDIAKKSEGDYQNRINVQQGQLMKEDKKSDSQSKSKGRDSAPSIKINVGSQFSKKSMEVLKKRKNEDIDGVPMEEGTLAKKSKPDEPGLKSILKRQNPMGQIDMFESDDKNKKMGGSQGTSRQTGESQYKRRGNLINVPIQKGNIQQKTQAKPPQQQEIGNKIEVLQNRVAQKFSSEPQQSSEPLQEDHAQGNVSPQTLSYLKAHQVRQQKTSYSSSESDEESTDFIQRLKGPEGLISLMDIDVSGAQSNRRSIQETLQKWDYLAEKQKIQREKEKLARKEAKLKKMMEKAPILMQEYEESEKKRQDKKKSQENDPLIKLLQSALEAAQQKANIKRSPSPVLTDLEEEDMSVSEDEDESAQGGEFIIDYGHKSIAGEKETPRKMTRRQRRALRMDQKKAEREYRKKLEDQKRQESLSEKDSRDELTEMLKTSLQAVQEHLQEMRKEKPLSQQEQSVQNPFLQDLMSRVQTHIQNQQAGGASSSALTAPPSSQSSSIKQSLPQTPYTQATTDSSVATSSEETRTSWASHMQPQPGFTSISPYVPVSKNASKLPSNTFEYDHGSKGAQPGWSGFEGDFRDEVSTALHGQTVEHPAQEVREVFDYGHKSKAEATVSQPDLQRGDVNAASSQPPPQTDIHSLTIESISEILKVAKNLQASQSTKGKGSTGKQTETTDSEQHQKGNSENLKTNSVSEFLKNMPQSSLANSSSESKTPVMDKNVSGQSSAGPTGTRMHFHGSQGRNNQRNQDFGQRRSNYAGNSTNQNKNMSSNSSLQKNSEKSESPPVEMFVGMERSRYERQKHREKEENQRGMEKKFPENQDSFGGQQNRGNNVRPGQGMGRESALPSARSFRTGQTNSNQSSFGHNQPMNNRSGRQHSPMQNSPGQNMHMENRPDPEPGQSVQNRPGLNNHNRSGQNSQYRPGQNMHMENRSDHSVQNRPGLNDHNRSGQNSQYRPGQNMHMENRSGQAVQNRPDLQTYNKSGQNTYNRSRQSTQNRPGSMQNRPSQMKHQHQGHSNMSQSDMHKKREAESITDLMTTNELQSWEDLQRQLRQSYLEDQIAGPTMSAYDQRLQQGNQQRSSKQQQQASSLDWFQQSKQLQMQDKLKKQSAPKGILKGAPSTASKIWAEDDMEFHTPPQQTAKWGQGVTSFDYSDRWNKGQNSNLVHYANSDSD